MSSEGLMYRSPGLLASKGSSSSSPDAGLLDQYSCASGEAPIYRKHPRQ